MGGWGGAAVAAPCGSWGSVGGRFDAVWWTGWTAPGGLRPWREDLVGRKGTTSSPPRALFVSSTLPRRPTSSHVVLNTLPTSFANRIASQV